MEHVSAVSRLALYVGDWSPLDQVALERALATLEAGSTEARAPEALDGGPPWLCMHLREGGADLYGASRLGRPRQYRAATVPELIGRIRGAASGSGPRAEPGKGSDACGG